MDNPVGQLQQAPKKSIREMLSPILKGADTTKKTDTEQKSVREILRPILEKPDSFGKIPEPILKDARVKTESLKSSDEPLGKIPAAILEDARVKTESLKPSDEPLGKIPAPILEGIETTVKFPKPSDEPERTQMLPIRFVGRHKIEFKKFLSALEEYLKGVDKRLKTGANDHPNTIKCRKHILQVLSPVLEDLNKKASNSTLSVSDIKGTLDLFADLESTMKEYNITSPDLSDPYDGSNRLEKEGILSKLYWIHETVKILDSYNLSPSSQEDCYLDKLNQKHYIYKRDKEIILFKESVNGEEDQVLRNGKWEQASPLDKKSVFRIQQEHKLKLAIEEFNSTKDKSVFDSLFRNRSQMILKKDSAEINKFDETVKLILSGSDMKRCSHFESLKRHNYSYRATDESDLDTATKYLIAYRFADLFYMNPSMIKPLFDSNQKLRIVITDRLLLDGDKGKEEDFTGVSLACKAIVITQRGTDIVPRENIQGALIHELAHALDSSDHPNWVADGITDKMKSIRFPNGRTAHDAFIAGRDTAYRSYKTYRKSADNLNLDKLKSKFIDPATGFSNYSFTNDTEFFAETLALFADFPERLPPDLYQAYSAMLKQDPLESNKD